MFKNLNEKIISADKVFDKVRFLSNNTIKIIAVIAMVCDHFSKVVWPFLRNNIFEQMVNNGNVSYFNDLDYFMIDILQGIGRMAFPLFCFLLVEGFCHTKNRKRYLLLMFIFALISEIPFDIALFNDYTFVDGSFKFYFGDQNVLFTLFLGLITLSLIEKAEYKGESRFQKIKSLILQLICVIIGAVAAYLLKTDFSYKGILFISAFYFLRKNRIYQILAFIFLYFITGKPISIFIIITCLIILLYNGKRGKLKLKYFFYLFYPLHLIILYLISLLYR